MYILIFSYILLLLVGSLIGFFKAGSTASLIAGLVSSFFLTLFTLLWRKGFRAASIGLLLTVLGLDSFFTWRWIKTAAFLPAGILSILSTILLIIISLRIQKQI